MARIDAETAYNQMISMGLKPLKPYPGSTKFWKCKCQYCGKVIVTTRSRVLSRTSLKGCASCGIFLEDQTDI